MLAYPNAKPQVVMHLNTMSLRTIWLIALHIRFCFINRQMRVGYRFFFISVYAENRGFHRKMKMKV